MSERVGLVRCPEARIYDHGPQHPLRPERVLLTWELIDAYGIGQGPGVVSLGAEAADDATLLMVHTAEFIDATKRAGAGEEGSWSRFGYGPGDNPIFDRMHEAGALVVGASLAAARAVWTGEVAHAFNAAGGLHHAMPARASGFCVYDDPAVAIAWMLAQGAERVAYVDVDVHHGDGVQAIFYDDPRVLTVSIHQYAPEIGFFPGTGGLTERGGPGAEGSAVNVPMPPGVSDAAWLEAFRAVVPEAVRRFHPDVLVTQLGCDTHHTDPLAHMRLTTGAYRETAEGAARARARDRGWSMGGDRRRRLSVGARRPARVDDLLRRDGRRAAPGPDPGGVARARRVPPARRGAHHALRVAVASRCRGRGRARDRRGRAPCGARRGARTVTPGPSSSARSGPASASPKLVRALVEAGTSIFRINFSHGAPKDHARSVRLVREVEEQVDRPLAVLADLPGPKVRLGTVAPDPFRFRPGQRFTLRPGEAGDEHGASTTYPRSADDLRAGDRVLLADGAVELTVAAVDGSTVAPEVRAGWHGALGPGRQRAGRAAGPAAPSPIGTMSASPARSRWAST